MLLTDNWKKVKITDLFNIEGGKALNKENEQIDGKYWHIGGGENNNGRSFRTNLWNFENVISVSRAGTAGASFYQKGKVFLGERTRALIPKFNYTDNNMNFIATICNKIFRNIFSYGKGATTARLQQEFIYLPFKDNHIDWEWIEEFMKTLDASIIKIKYKTSTSPVNTDTWKKFSITDLFNIQGGKTVIKEDWGEPIYPYVGSSSINNGITGKCNQWNYENTISINSTGSVGYAFWHPYKFLLSSNCRTLIPKFNITNNIGLFICTILTKVFTNNYSYGKNLTTTRLQQESIYLPEKDGKPDWEYMENFMNELIQE